jgi:hypothetical protein
MKRDNAILRIAAVTKNAPSRFFRLTRSPLSPLSAIGLAVLTAFACGAGFFALYAAVSPVESDGIVNVADWTPPTLGVVDLYPPKPASADTESLSRPIFAKDRKPASKTAASATEAVVEGPTGVTVAAIVRHNNATKAFLVSPDAPDGEWRKVGDAVEAWTVTSITATEVVLESGGQLSKLKLYGEATPDAGSEAPADDANSDPASR